MFVTATLTTSRPEAVVAVPESAVLHLHDLSYVFVPGNTPGTFHRVLVSTGDVVNGNLIEVQSGLGAGQQVVANALDLQNTADQ